MTGCGGLCDARMDKFLGIPMQCIKIVASSGAVCTVAYVVMHWVTGFASDIW
jgi:hypothetical protein